MKQNFKIFIFTYFFLFPGISFFQEIDDSHTRTIYDFYSDEHNSGKWQGYAFLLPSDIDMSAQTKITKKLLVLNQTGLYIEDTIYFNPINFCFICDFEENLPCSVVKFQRMFSSNFKKFEKTVQTLTNAKHIQDVGEQCMVLHVSFEKTRIEPYVICLHVLGQGANLKMAVKKICFIINSDNFS